MTETLPAGIARALGRVVSTSALRGIERLRPPLARKADDVPVSAEAITVEWLTEVLCGDHPGVQVRRAVSSGESSQTTSRVALALTYTDGAPAELPRNVFVKLSTTAKQRLFLGLIRILDGEPEFYDRLRPLADFECPSGYFGAMNHRSWASAVVIEDISATRGAEFCHATSSVGRADIESLLETMAAYHGAYWEHPAVTASTLKRPTDHLHNVGLFLSMRKQAVVGAERAGDEFPVALRSRHDELWRALNRSMEDLSHGGPVTLLHGDPHVGNTYRTAEGRMALADWQVVMRGQWAYDVAGALASSLTTEDRRAWECDLLAHYLRHLEAAGGRSPTFDHAWRLYKQSLMYPLFCWTTVLGAPSWMPDTQPADVSKLIIGRVARAIDDLDALAEFGSTA